MAKLNVAINSVQKRKGMYQDRHRPLSGQNALVASDAVFVNWRHLDNSFLHFSLF